MWQAIENSISGVLGESFKVLEREPVGGGCINEAFLLRGEQLSCFIKLNQADRLSMFEAEAAGLAAIRASCTLQAPQPLAWGVAGERSWLALEYIQFSPALAGSGALLGERLAAMHACSADAFGWDRDNTIGATPQPNPWTESWIRFLRQQRIGFQLELAAGKGLAAATLARGEQLLELLPRLFEGYQPPPSLLHGDLWGGNWCTDSGGNPVVFDPAVYYGDRESDLAMTELFGGFDRDFYAAYRAAWPLDAGYAARRDLYQLYQPGPAADRQTAAPGIDHKLSANSG